MKTTTQIRSCTVRGGNARSGAVGLVACALALLATMALSGCTGYTSKAATGGQPAATPQVISATPTSVTFANVVAGTTNSQPILLKNNGNTTLTFSQVTPAGTGFSITGLSASTTIAPAGSVTFNVVFTATSSATVNGSVTLVMPGQPSPLVISLTGTGSAATSLLGASPTSLNLSTVSIGASKSLTSTLTNNGNSSINVSGVTVVGAGLTATGISGATILTPGQSATLTVTFAPTTAGALTGASVQIASNATNSPATVSVSGTGEAAGSHSVALSWAPSTSTGITGYNVYRAMTSGGYGATPMNPSPLAGTTYTDTSVAAGGTYFYVTTAVDPGGQSVDSNEVTAVIP
jgi:hypothetical protein